MRSYLTLICFIFAGCQDMGPVGVPMPDEPTIYSNFRGHTRTSTSPRPLVVAAPDDTTRHEPGRLTSGFYRVRSMEAGTVYTVSVGAENEMTIECCKDGARQYFVAYRPDVDSLFLSTDVELAKIGKD